MGTDKAVESDRCPAVSSSAQLTRLGPPRVLASLGARRYLRSPVDLESDESFHGAAPGAGGHDVLGPRRTTRRRGTASATSLPSWVALSASGSPSEQDGAGTDACAFSLT